MQIPQPTSDDRLRVAILLLLAEDVRTTTADLRVGVLNGVAHIAGSVDSLETRTAVEELAWRVEGVRGVVNRIDAPGGPSPAREISLDFRKP